MSKTEYDCDKLFLAYEEARADITAHFRKIMELQKELAAKDTEIADLKKRISWLESGLIHTCHAECKKPLCVANREIERLKAENERLYYDNTELQGLVEACRVEIEEFSKCHSENFDRIMSDVSKIEKLKAELAAKDAVIEWYADKSNWCDLEPGPHSDTSVVDSDDLERNAPFFFKVGGKRAREVMAKYRKSEG